MPQVTTNQNTKPCQRTTDTQSPAPITPCLTATSITTLHLTSLETQALPSTAVKLSVAMLHCLWKTQPGPEIATAVSRNVSCWKNVPQYIHGGCSAHRLCFAGTRRFSSKCRKLPAVAVTVRWLSPLELCGEMTENTPHTVAEG